MEAFAKRAESFGATFTEGATIVSNAIANVLTDAIKAIHEAQFNIVGKLVRLTHHALAVELSNLAGTPQLALCFALLDKEEQELTKVAIDRLWELYKESEVVVAGEPPILLVCGEQLRYETFDILLQKKPIKPSCSLQTALNAIPDLIRKADSSRAYQEKQEIKRQGSSKKRQEVSLTTETEDGELDLSSVEQHSKWQDSDRDSIAEMSTLSTSIERQAHIENYRGDRIKNLLLVLEFMLVYGVERGWQTRAAEELGISRETVNQRAKDIKSLIEKINSGEG